MKTKRECKFQGEGTLGGGKRGKGGELDSTWGQGGHCHFDNWGFPNEGILEKWDGGNDINPYKKEEKTGVPGGGTKL